MSTIAVQLPRSVGVNQSSVTTTPVERICCPRCEYKFPHKVVTNVVERVVAREPRPVEEVLHSFDLRPKELQAAQGLAAGKRIREIAVMMRTTEGTVKQYLRYVYLKTGTHSRQMFRMKIDELRFQA